MSKTPIAVLLSDVHYSLPTLEVADKATRMAIAHANDLNVPLIVCGDLHDTKANLRGECVNAMLHTFATASHRPYVLRGNHDSINERSAEHSLSFLGGVARVLDVPTGRSIAEDIEIQFIPYQHDADKLRSLLKTFSKHTIIIMHQGVQGSQAGHYFLDKSAVLKEDLAGRRVISGHYHPRQQFIIPDGGLMDYVGNPYTLGFGEANHPDKGFQVLYSDGSLEFVPTNLRKHVIVECGFQPNGTFAYAPTSHLRPGDIIWIKCSGPTDVICDHNKATLATLLDIWCDFRLDLIPTDSAIQKLVDIKDLSQAEILDSIIESTNSTSERKTKLKSLWKQLIKGE